MIIILKELYISSVMVIKIPYLFFSFNHQIYFIKKTFSFIMASHSQSFSKVILHQVKLLFEEAS